MPESGRLRAKPTLLAARRHEFAQYRHEACSPAVSCLFCLSPNYPQ